jgi:hypothetical protein
MSRPALPSDDLDFLKAPDIADIWAPIGSARAATETPQFHPVQALADTHQHQASHQQAIFHHHDGSDDSMPQAHLYLAPMGGGTGTLTDTTPSMASETAYISGIDASGHVVGTSFWSWNNDNPATYAARSDVHKWGSSAPGTTGGTVNFYFDPASNWTATEKAQMTACINLWSDLANIHFSLTANAASADITFERGSDGNAVTPAGWTGTGQAGVVGGSTLWTMTDATVSIDTSVPGFGPMDGDFQSIGGYVWMTIEHELGHAIGLGHGGGYNGNVNESTQQFSAFDTRLWSIMSYIDPDLDDAKYFSQYTVTGTDWGRATDGYGNVPTTPMLLDILAIQGLYGAPTTTVFDGGQTFGFNCNISDATIEQFFDFTKNVNPVVTLWDAGTGNTLDLSGYNSASTINLNPETFSSCNGQINNLCIGPNTKIDAAIGGKGGDTFIANTDADHLTGGNGNDTFDYGANLTADDINNGGSGSKDTVVLDGNYASGLTFKAATMVNMEFLVLTAGHSYSFISSDKTVAAGKLFEVDGHSLGATDTLTFNGSKELDGKFNLRGGEGNDQLTGGAGNDIITGLDGLDTLRGGLGHDTFLYKKVVDSVSITHDRIFDFDASQDKFDLWFSISGVATAINTGTVNAGSVFDTDVKNAVGALGAHQAVLLTPNSGAFAGHVLLIVDVNGTVGYQGGHDLIIDLESPTHIGSFSASNFI